MATSVPGETSDGHEELLAQLRDLVPSAFSDGQLDREALLGALNLRDGFKESFQFTWPGLDQARKDARAATTATLVPDEGASLNWTTARDVLIEGDNLQVLKLLKNGYSRSVKLIYIDPPYNTGDTFTYNDDFAVPEAEYLTTTGQVDDQGQALSSRVETKGRKHAPWLTMMFSRLVLSRQLLKRDGVTLVSIDNNEVHHLRLLLDAVYGAENFVDMITWQGGRKGDAKLTSGGQDYILVYARDRSFLTANDVRWRERKSGLDGVYAMESELLERHGKDFEAAKKELRDWFAALPEGHPSKAHAHYSFIDEDGVWTSDNSASPNYRANLVYDFKGYKPPEKGWRYEKATMERLHAEGRLIYPSGRASRVRIKKYLHDQEYWAPGSSFVKDRSGASSALDRLMGSKVFDDPKSTEVLARLFSSMTNEGDTILDFFSGSGSTGQAVWELNARQGGSRSWVLVQIPETPNTDEPSGENAANAGYGTIFELTAERMRRTAKELAPLHGTQEFAFRVFRARTTNLVVEKPLLAIPETSEQAYFDRVLSAAYGSPVLPHSTPEAVAWEVALKATDTRLNSGVIAHDVDHITTYEFRAIGAEEDTGRLLVSLDAFTLETADALELSDDDTLILRGDKVDDSVTLTLAPRLQSKLILLERIPREVSL
ncbi:site-specific DNA-methyltransferase [Nesterenkonia sp. AY15]|uniref:site-specific DNA-methyltransferase n=1 Tax=Nesterenkonia sp. AY15 TaxID=2901139 RepID=UPI001F4CCB42|nr:site-specific DNA-methyltransferase [Nesterenkonia sp. AY15]MCH8570250.1 site-specific DNA-methyltransferase [Nesterenkonia sp. AY15]